MKSKNGKFDVATLRKASVLYVEDELEVHKFVSEYLQMHFETVYSAYNGREGLDLFKKYTPDVVVTDIRMPVMSGLEMAEHIKHINPATPVVIISAYYDEEHLMKAIDIGIDKYVRKPVDGDKLVEAIYKCTLPVFQQKEIETLNKNILTSLETRISKSPCMQEVLLQIRKVAKSDFSVIIHGETGVGKSYISQIIHDLSARASQPFVSVDIGAIPETLVESELFGHTKGAYTGAAKYKKGFFEIAQGGTLLLEELENMSLYVQSKLLRVVEDKKVYPLGSTTPIDVNIRIIGATNKNIFDEVKKNHFREDLFYRLCEFDIFIPPLRERPEDILFLATRFVNEVAEELNRHIKGISPEAEKILLNYHWKGNVREIKNVMRRAVLLCDEEVIGADVVSRILDTKQADSGLSAIVLADTGDYSLDNAIADAEKTAILKALKKSEGKKVKAAGLLKIDYKTLVAKMNRYGIGKTGD